MKNFSRKPRRTVVRKLKAKSQCYSAEDMTTIDTMAQRGKGKVKIIKPGRKFSAYIKKMMK
jgi:hypothetical protein